MHPSHYVATGTEGRCGRCALPMGNLDAPCVPTRPTGDENAPSGLPAPTPAIVESATQYHERTTRERKAREARESTLERDAIKYHRALAMLCGCAVAYKRSKHDASASPELKQAVIDTLLAAAESFADLDP